MLQNMLQRRFVRNGRRTGLNVASHNIMCGTHRAMRELSKVASFCCDKKKLQGCSVHYGHCTDLNTTPHNIMCKTRCRHARHQGTRSKQLHDDDDDNEDTDDKLQACGQEKLKCDKKPRMLDIRGKSQDLSAKWHNIVCQTTFRPYEKSGKRKVLIVSKKLMQEVEGNCNWCNISVSLVKTWVLTIRVITISLCPFFTIRVITISLCPFHEVFEVKHDFGLR